MARYLLQRLAGLIFVLFAISAITFTLMHSVPGGPCDVAQLKSNITIPEGVKVPPDALELTVVHLRHDLVAKLLVLHKSRNIDQS